MIKPSSKLNLILSVLSLCLVVAGSAMTCRNDFLRPKASEISTVSAQGTFGNINLMTKDEFAERPGIGSTLAERIVEYRDEHGNFTSPEQIMEVKGIGEGKFGKIKDIIYTSI